MSPKLFRGRGAAFELNLEPLLLQGPERVRDPVILQRQGRVRRQRVGEGR